MVTTIGEILPEAARRFGNKISLIVEGEGVQLRGHSTRCRTRSRMKWSLIGVLLGDRVTLYGPKQPAVGGGVRCDRQDGCGGELDQRDADASNRFCYVDQGPRGARA